MRAQVYTHTHTHTDTHTHTLSQVKRREVVKGQVMRDQQDWKHVEAGERERESEREKQGV